MRAVFGADKLDSGEIYVKGEKVHIRTPKDAIKRKIAFLTEDRKGQGLVLNLDVRTNLVLANMKGFSNGPFLDKDRIEQAGNDNVSALKIKTPSLNEVVGQLSGGNQQKVVIGKWVNTDADIFIFDEPTRYRRGRQDRGLPGHERSGEGRQVRHHGLLRAAGDPGYERPCGSYARRPSDG